MHVTIDETDAGQKNEYELNVDLKDLPADVLDDMSRGDYGKLIALEKAVAGMKESEAASDSDRDFVSDSEGIGRWERTVFNTDDRIPVIAHSATNFPYCAVGYLESGCTAILIGPNHALTAAHCVHDKNTNIR